MFHIEYDDWFTHALLNALSDPNYPQWMCIFIQMTCTTCVWYIINCWNGFNDALFAIANHIQMTCTWYETCDCNKFCAPWSIVTINLHIECYLMLQWIQKILFMS